MPVESSSEVVIRYGFPLFWIGIGVVQWFWPSAIFVAFSDEQVTPGARGGAVLWLVLGSTLGYVLIPWVEPLGGWFIPGVVLLIIGGLQFVHPVRSVSVGRRPGRMTAILLATGGGVVLSFGLL